VLYRESPEADDSDTDRRRVSGVGYDVLSTRVIDPPPHRGASACARPFTLVVAVLLLHVVVVVVIYYFYYTILIYAIERVLVHPRQKKPFGGNDRVNINDFVWSELLWHGAPSWARARYYIILLLLVLLLLLLLRNTPNTRRRCSKSISAQRWGTLLQTHKQ